MFLTYVLFILGFIILIKGAGWLVDGASSLAVNYGVSTLVVGLTIVSLGTSAPELVVNILASAKGSSGLALGNILGSNIANIFFILGGAALVYPLALKRNTVWKEIPFALLAAIVLFLFVNDARINQEGASVLSKSDGLVLLAFMLIFISYVFAIVKNGAQEEEEGIKIKKINTSKSIAYIIIGSLGLFFGGRWIVEGAIEIASLFNVSETLIGLTIVALGTSLPEMATSVAAAQKKQTDILVGNIVGSNIFNIFLVLGTIAIIRPVPFSPELNFDIVVVLAATMFLFLAMFLGKRHKLERWQGLAFVLLYIGYLTFAILRG